jgi:thymidylate synthase
MDIHYVEARDLPDLWFQAVHDILDKGRRFTVDRGSYAGQTRLEYDYFTGLVRHPGTQPILPDIPQACGIPNPVEDAYIYGGEGYERSYIEYLMTGQKAEGESYTYGERLTRAPLTGAKLTWWEENNTEIIDKREVDGKIIIEEDGQLYLNQIEWAIHTYKNLDGATTKWCCKWRIPRTWPCSIRLACAPSIRVFKMKPCILWFISVPGIYGEGSLRIWPVSKI